MSENNGMLAVGIEGSPRRTGNSTALLKAYLDGVASVGFDTQSIYLNRLNYKGCGDFGEVKVLAESNMGPRDAWKSRPDLIEKLRQMGIQQAKELMGNVQ
jgi:multimeric flavodoxin WrbA